MPTASAMNSSPKKLRARPRYIGLPCRRWPGVPPELSTWSICVSGSAKYSGMRPPSKTMLLEPLPLRPSVCPQSSSIVHSLRGATKSIGGRRAGRQVGAGRQRLAEVMRRVRGAGAIAVGAGELEEAVAGLARPADRGGHRRAQEVGIGEQLVLGALVEPRRDEQRVRRGQADLPRRRRAAAGEVGDDPDEGRHVELEAAVAARDEHAVEARLAELLVGVGRVAGALLGLGLAGDQRGGDGRRPGDQLVGGDRDGRHCAVYPPSAMTTAPVMKLDAGEARKTMMRAISRGEAMRPSGCDAPMSAARGLHGPARRPGRRRRTRCRRRLERSR